MKIKNIKVKNKKEEVDITLNLSFDEMYWIKNIIKFNECGAGFSEFKIKCVGEEELIPVNAILIEAPNHYTDEALNVFTEFLDDFTYIRFPTSDGHVI